MGAPAATGLLIAVYLGLNTGLNLANRVLLGGSFPFPFLLTLSHLSFAWLALLGPVRGRSGSWRKQWRGLLASGFFMAFNVGCNNMSHVFLPLALTQTLRRAPRCGQVGDRAFARAASSARQVEAGSPAADLAQLAAPRAAQGGQLALMALMLSPGCWRRASLPVVTAVVAVFVEAKRPSRHETWALVLLTAGVCLTVFEGNAAGNAVGLALAVAGTREECPRRLPGHSLPV